jgi:hypothetical protein
VYKEKITCITTVQVPWRTEWGQRAKNAPEAKAQSIWSRIAVVLCCALLYAFMGSPMLWHVQSANAIPSIYQAGGAVQVESSSPIA